MLNKKDFLKYASKLAFPIMLQNLIGTLVNIADTVMLGYVSQTAMSASSLANQYTFILFCLYYGMATGTSVLCAQYWGKGDKKTVEKILGLAERISLIVSLIFFVVSFTMPTMVMKIFTNSPGTIAAGSVAYGKSIAPYVGHTITKHSLPNTAAIFTPGYIFQATIVRHLPRAGDGQNPVAGQRPGQVFAAGAGRSVVRPASGGQHGQQHQCCQQPG